MFIFGKVIDILIEKSKNMKTFPLQTLIKNKTIWPSFPSF